MKSTGHYRHIKLRSAHLKVERAAEHMRDFESYASKHFGREFAPYSSTTKRDPKTGKMIEEFSIIEEHKDRFALICGDAVHNLRTALDMAWYEITGADTDPKEVHKIKFPIYPTREHLISFFKAREKQNSVVSVSGNLLDTVKPYKGSNVIGDGLYHLHQVDMLDKHKLMIPQVQVSQIWDYRAQDSTDETIAYLDLINTYGTKVKDQGELSAAIIFGEGMSVEGKSVLPTLKWFKTAVEVTLLFLEH